MSMSHYLLCLQWFRCVARAQCLIYMPVWMHVVSGPQTLSPFSFSYLTFCRGETYRHNVHFPAGD